MDPAGECTHEPAEGWQLESSIRVPAAMPSTQVIKDANDEGFTVCLMQSQTRSYPRFQQTFDLRPCSGMDSAAARSVTTTPEFMPAAQTCNKCHHRKIKLVACFIPVVSDCIF